MRCYAYLRELCRVSSRYPFDKLRVNRLAQLTSVKVSTMSRTGNTDPIRLQVRRGSFNFMGGIWGEPGAGEGLSPLNER